MVPGNQNDSMSQMLGCREKDRKIMAYTLLDIGDTIKHELLSVWREKNTEIRIIKGILECRSVPGI